MDVKGGAGRGASGPNDSCAITTVVYLCTTWWVFVLEAEAKEIDNSWIAPCGDFN